MSEKPTHIIFKILKITGWILLALVILLAAVRFSLKTNWVQKLAKTQIISLANQNLNGTLSIGSLEGDLWKELHMADITLTQTSDTLLYADTLQANYELLSLLKRSLTINNIRLGGVRATIRETEEQTFNFQELIKTDSVAETPKEEPMNFGIDVQQINIQKTSLTIYSPSYLPDSSLAIQDIEAAAGFSFQNQITATLSSLSFKVIEGRLPEPISVSTAASYTDERITLNKLAIETGRSMLGAGGFMNRADSSLTANLQMLPFSLADLQPYLTEDFREDEFTIGLTATGSFDALNLQMQVESRVIEELVLNADLSLSGVPSLNEFGINGKNLDVAYFTNDSVDAHIGEFRFSAEGRVTEEIKKAELTWEFSFQDMRYQEQSVQTLFGNGTLADQKLVAAVELNEGNEAMVTHAEIEALFTEDPHWKVETDFSDINLGKWAQNPELESALTFSAKAEGTGFVLGENPWLFAVYKANLPEFENGQVNPAVRKLRVAPADTMFIAGQKLSDVGAWGSITADTLVTEGYIQLINDRVSFETTLANYLSEEPTYAYQLKTTEFNLVEINSLSELESTINLQLTGNGRYFDPEILELDAYFLTDSSYINGTSLDTLGFNLNLKAGILNIPDGALQSNVIAGTFSCRRNLYNQTDPENEMALDMTIKNLQPLAPFVGAEVLNADGKITGNITDHEEGELRFMGNVNLKDIYLDEKFKAGSIVGNTNIYIDEIYGFDIDVEIAEPVFSGVELQDINFTTRGDATPDSASGNFSLQIKSSDSGEIVQNGMFEVNLQNLKSSLTWNVFTFKTPARVMSLESPFHLDYADGTVKTDTLRLWDQENTFLHLAIPHVDSTRQQAFVEGQNFDFGVIQEILFGECFVEGILSGFVQISRDSAEFNGEGELTTRNLTYLESTIDTLRVNFEVKEERLRGQLSMYLDGEEKARGHLDVPFLVGDPTTFDEAFFEESVDGALTVRPTDLSKFETILKEYEIATNTRGVIQFDGSLSGTAGEPNFEGLFNLGDPVLSGIAVDSVFAAFQYHHVEQNVTGRAEIQARGQNAASINAELPVSMNFKTFEFNMPTETDTLRFNLVTDNFNISVFNDFLDKQYLRGLKGVVNADLNVVGTTEELVSQGYFRLRNSEVTVPVAGIKLSGIVADFSVSETGLRLEKLSAKSGSGNFNASGNIELEGIQPVNLDIDARARRFRLANTSNYNLIIDLNSQLTGSPTQPVASGDLTIKNGFIYLQDFGEESVEKVELEEEESSSFSPYDSLAIDMEFKIERGFFVRNSRYLDLEVELTGQLEAQKQSNQELQLFGNLTGEEGYARPLGKLFELEEANFTFSGPVDEPELNIRTSYVPQSSQKEGDPIVLYYIIEGNAQDPEFRFESEPYMEQQDIICYTLFSKPCYALESWQQVVSGQGGSSPSDLLVDVLLDEVEALATQQLGIDVVQIDNTRSGSGGGTSIKTGWYLNRRTFFAIVNEISGSTPQTLFILEYLLTENLDLILTQGDDSRQGIDLRWRYDY